jgi:hypothetical protein
MGDGQRAHLILEAQGIDTPGSTSYAHLAGRKTIKEAAEERELLSAAERKQLKAAVMERAHQRRPMRLRQITQMAQDIINARKPGSPKVKLGKNWAQKWLACTGLRTYTSKKLSFEQNRALVPKTAEAYFDVLEEIDAKHHIKAENKYAMDETPGMFGYGNAMVVVGPKGQKDQYHEQSGDHWSFTIVATICASGDPNASPKPAVIFKAKWRSHLWPLNNSLGVL